MTAFLTFCALTSAEDFGAEILRPVGPANAAAGHFAKSQMHAFDTRRIDENLIQRPRQRHIVELAARELDRDQFLRLAVVIKLIEVGADRGLHRVDEAAQDAILVEAVDCLQRGLDRGGDGGLARRAFVCEHAEMRVEADVEQSHDLRRDAGVLAQRRPHVVLRKRHADLAQKARQRADQRDIAPDQPGRQHQRVIAVILGASAHDGEEAALDLFPSASRSNGWPRCAFQRHVMEPDVRASSCGSMW